MSLARVCFEDIFVEQAGPWCLTPFASAPQLISMGELMQYIPVKHIYMLSRMLHDFDALCQSAVKTEPTGGQNPLPEPQRIQIIGVFKGAMAAEFARVLPFSSDLMARAINELEATPPATTWRTAELFRDIGRRIEDELAKEVHLQIDRRLVPLYAHPTDPWAKVIEKYPQIEHDAAEASYCLALYRWTACSFHLMRILECGLDQLAKKARVPKKRPGWDGLLEGIDKSLKPAQGVKKTKAKRERDRFIAAAAMELRTVKEARNTTMHDYTVKLDGNQAIALFKAVLSFMNKMAEAL